MRLENYIYGKKMIFIRTILVREDKCIYKKVLRLRARKFNKNIEEGIQNQSESPILTG